MKKLTRILHRAFIGFILAVCIIMGVAPVIPKRKEQYSIEVKIEEKEKNNTSDEYTFFLKTRE